MKVAGEGAITANLPPGGYPTIHPGGIFLTSSPAIRDTNKENSMPVKTKPAPGLESVSIAPPVTVEEALEAMLPLLKREHETIIEQCDWLASHNVTDEVLAQVAQHSGVSVKTLRRREAFARAYPPNKRRADVHYSVYNTLLRIPDAKARQDILDLRGKGEWTVEAMEQQVRNYVEKQTGKADAPHKRTKSGMKVGDIVVHGVLVNGRLKITIESPIEGEPLVFNDGTEVVISAQITGY